MKTITTILLVLFLIITLLLGFMLANKFFINEAAEPESLENNKTEDANTAYKEPEKESEEEAEINKIEVYLDGDKEHGIFLGEAEYNLKSKEAELLYGKNFGNKGFRFIMEDTTYSFEPGSTHYFYIYTYNPSSGWDYLRQEINIPGETTKDDNIKILIDFPKENEVLSDNMTISGWAFDISSAEGTGIKEVNVYLDGPKDMGYLLGSTEYGKQRQDVADHFSNQNYANSGYVLKTDLSDFEAGSKHTLFIYAVSENLRDSFNFEKRKILISGNKEKKSIINANINLESLIQNNTIEITGWAADKQLLFSEIQNIEKDYSIKKIVFTSNRDGDENIYSINLDGTELKRLTDYPGNDMYPEVSPDGKKIAYTSDINGVWQTMIMDWDGGNKRQITSNSFRSGYPGWSFDSKYIYFEGDIDENWELFRIDSDGSNQTRLTFNLKHADWHPSGHPFEYRVIYESGVTGHEDLYIMDYDGSNIKKICKENQRRRTPDVLYDESKIVYARYTNNQSDVWIMDYSGENETKLTDNPGWDGHPAFSPNGEYIAYDEEAGKKGNIIIMDLNGENKVNITNHNSANYDPAFLYQE